MQTPPFILDTEPTASAILRARVDSVLEDGTIMVETEHGASMLCDTLQSGHGDAVVLEAGDVVLIWHSNRGDERAVVMGRVGPHRAPLPVSPSPPEDEIPESLTIEAKQSLTLRVGDGSITIREDGRILIKGKDLVSHAQRMNRIKGGAVSIN
jgi:hypothetical protein